MKIEKIAIDKLLLDPANARKHGQKNLDSIKGSLAKFGQQKPIVVNADNVIVAGNGTMQAAKELGWKEINIVRTDLKGSDITAFGIADNRTSELAEWDDKVLLELLEGLNAEDFDLSAIGFDIDDMNEMLGDKNKAGLTDPDEVPEPPKVPKTKLGDIWQLGNHRLMCGDSTSKEQVEKLMDGQKADMVFTDPPYQLQTQGGGILKESRAMKKIKALGIDEFDPSVLVAHAATSVFCCNKPLIPNYIKIADEWGVSWDLAVYHKQNVTPNYGGHLMTDLEYIFIIGKQSPNTGIGEDKALYSKLYAGGKDADNETAWSKPVALCEKFIKLYSTKAVLDLFGGSGSTLIACEKTARKCYMMELDEKYCDVIIKRWQDFTGKKAVLINEN